MSAFNSDYAALNTFFIEEEEDFVKKAGWLRKAGNILEVKSGTYFLKQPFSHDNQWTYPEGVVVNYHGQFAFPDFITYTGTETFHSGSPGDVRFFGVRMNISNNSGTLFNLKGTGQVPVFLAEDTIFAGNGVGGARGTLENFNLRSRDTNFNQFTEALRIIDCPAFNFDASVFVEGFATGVGPVLEIDGADGGNISDTVFVATGSLINILPANTGSINIVRNTNTFKDAPFNTEFFTAATLSGGFGAVVDNMFTNESANLVDFGGFALLQALAGPPWYKTGLQVVLAGFTNYDNKTYLMDVINEDTFHIRDIDTNELVPYTVNDSGDISFQSLWFQSNSTLPPIGTSVNVTDTIDYDRGYDVKGHTAFLPEGVDGFIVEDGTFVGTEAGSFDNASLDETSKFVDAENNPGLADSKNIGALCVVGNTTPTVLTQNVWTDLNFTSSPAIAAANIELWRVFNPVTGELQIQDINDFSGLLAASISYQPTGSQNYQFRVIINDSPLAIAQIFPTSSQGGADNSLTPIVGIKTSPDDRVRMQVQNIDGNDNVTVTNFSLNIQ